MKIIRSVKQEIKKQLRLSYFMAGVLGMLLMLFCGIAYTDDTMREITILQMLFSGKASTLAAENNFLFPFALIRGFDKWFTIFVPSFVIIGYGLTIADEREKGEYRFLMMRETPLTYCLSKMLSLMLISGTMVLLAYSSYVLILKLILNDYFSLTASDSEIIVSAMGTKSVFWFAVKFCVGAFVFGAFISLPGFIAGIFFNDRYMLVCVPILIEYIISQAFSFISQKNNNLSESLRKFRITNLMGGGVYGKWLFTLAFSTILMLGALVLFVIVCEKRKRSGKYV